MIAAAPRVVVTGGNGQVGRAIVRELSRRGARVAFTFLRNESVARELCAELPSVRALRLDLTQVPEIEPTLTTVAKELEGVDAFVHAAGLSSMQDPPRHDELADLDSAGWDR